VFLTGKITWVMLKVRNSTVTFVPSSVVVLIQIKILVAIREVTRDQQMTEMLFFNKSLQVTRRLPRHRKLRRKQRPVFH